MTTREKLAELAGSVLVSIAPVIVSHFLDRRPPPPHQNPKPASFAAYVKARRFNAARVG